MNIKDSLMESTILALQGKLVLDESKSVKTRKQKIKENIDISVMDNGSTVVDTDDATVTVQDKQSADKVIDTPEVVEVPVDSTETIIPEEEVSTETVEDIVEDEPTVDEIVDEPIEEGKICTDCKEKKEEDITIEVKEDEVEITSDEEHEVEVKKPEEGEETVEEEPTEETTTEEEIPEDVVEESKKLKTEDVDARPNETALLNYLEGIGTLDGSPAAKLAEDLIKWLSDDDVKRFAEIYEYPIFEEMDEGKQCKQCEKCGKDKVEEKQTINKFSSKTFNEALTKFYKGKFKAVESFKTTKINLGKDSIKIEGKLLNADKIGRNICLEMKKIQEGKSFTKFELVGTKGLIKESKDNSTTKMVTFLNKNKVLECKYVICK